MAKKSTASKALTTQEQAASTAVQQAQRPFASLAKKWETVKALKTEAEESHAGETLKEVKTLWNQLEAERKEIVAPLNGVVKKVNGKIKGMQTDLNALEKRIKSLLLDRQRKLRETALKQAEKEAKKAEKAGALEVAYDLREQAVNKEVLCVSGFSTRKQYSAQVIDKNKLPAEYLIPDQKKLDKLAIALKDDFSIPGCELVVSDIASQSL